MAEPDMEIYYSPEAVEGWLSRWHELLELARPAPPTLRYDADLAQHTPGHRPGDPTRYTDIVCDLERAWIQLPMWSIEWQTVKTLMDGYPLREMEVVYRLRHGTAGAALVRATRTMAEYLGWEG